MAEAIDACELVSALNDDSDGGNSDDDDHAAQVAETLHADEAQAAAATEARAGSGLGG